MSEFQKLRDATSNLKESVSNFPIGAVSLNDLKPIEERIKNSRVTLKHLKAKLLSRKAQNDFRVDSEELEEDIKETVRMMHETTSDALINEKAIKLCLHSHTILTILKGEAGDTDMQTKICGLLCKLFVLNDDMRIKQKIIDQALQKQLRLKIECQKALFEYKDFSIEQEEIRDKRLKETNPAMAKKKEKTQLTLAKINVMKRLITHIITASCVLLQEKPFFVEMLEKHREVVTMDTILNLAKENPSTNDAMPKQAQ